MKKLIFIWAFFAFFSVLLSAKELAKFTFSNQADLEKTPIWCMNGSEIAQTFSAAAPSKKFKGSMQLVVKKNTANELNSQLVFPETIRLYEGLKYKITITYKANKDISFEAKVIENYPNWMPLGHDATHRFFAKPNKWVTETMEFTAKADAKGNFRLPCCNLGALPVGTVLNIAEVLVEGNDNVPVRTFSVDNEFFIENMAAKKNYSYEAAYKEKNEFRELVSLNGMWQFAPMLENSAKIVPENSDTWANFIVPGHWRGGNITNFIHTNDGKRVTNFMETPIGEIRTAWYKRTMDIPANWQGRKVELYIGRVDMEADIYINGQRAGGTENFTTTRSVKLDISKFLKYGEINQFAIKIHTPGDLNQQRSGLAGHVYLLSKGIENFGDAIVNANVKKQCLNLRFRKPSVQNGSLNIAIRDAETDEIVYTDNFNFAKNLTVNYLPPKYWSPETPNLYYMDLELTQNGTVIDKNTIRFGVSDFSSDKGDYLLNGKKINLFGDTAFDTAYYWSCDYRASAEYIRRELKTMRAMNLNTVYFHEMMPKEILDIYDEEGIMVLGTCTLPYDDLLKMSDEEAVKVFKKKVQENLDSDRFDNHPSHAGFIVDIWFNFHAGSTNPEYIGLKSGVKSYPSFNADGKIITKTTPDPNLQGDRGERKVRLNKIAAVWKKAYPTKLIMSGGSGEVGSAYSTHIYHTWGAPFAEMRALFRRYGLQKDIPFFAGEHNIPYPLSLTNIYDFDSFNAKTLGTENFARLTGNDGYTWRNFYSPKVLLDVWPGSLMGSRHDRDEYGFSFIPADFYSYLFQKSLETITPGWRISGVNGVGFFGTVQSYHLVLAGKETPQKLTLPDDLSKLEFFPESPVIGPYTPPFGIFHVPYQLKPTLSTAPFQKVTKVLFAEFIETGVDEYGLDHAYFGGTTLKKNLLVINDSYYDKDITGKIILCDVNNNEIFSQDVNIQLPQGERKKIAVEFKLPKTLNKIKATLRASLQAGEQNFYANLPIEIFPKAPALELNNSLYVYDPTNGVKKYLKKINLPFVELKNLDNLPKQGTLIVGREALSRCKNIPNFNTVCEDGLNILIMEQQLSSAPEMMKVRSREAFINAEKHPILQGFEDSDFANWRGNFSIEKAYEINPPGYGWSAAGNRNMVAGYVFRRPSHGNYLSLLVSGFDMYQTPLLEYRHANASFFASQLEIVPRLGFDPVATTLFHRMISYLDNRGKFEYKTAFFGNKKGEDYIAKLKIKAAKIDDLTVESLHNVTTLIISDPDFGKLREQAVLLTEFVYNGGKIIYFNSIDSFDSNWLPFPLKLTKEKFRKAIRNNGKKDNFYLCGYDNNDFYYHNEVELPVFAEIPEQANAVMPGVLVDLPHGTGRFVFVSVTPDMFGETPAQGKTCRMISALLTNANVELANNSIIYNTFVSSGDFNLDLVPYTWSFAIDPDNVGLQQGVEKGQRGTLTWQQGLIADGCEVKIGRAFEQFLRYDYNGYAWYRLDLELPEILKSQENIYISIGAIDDHDQVYVNGELIGKTGEENPMAWCSPRVYKFSSAILKDGVNSIVVRVYDGAGGGGITTAPFTIGLRPTISSGKGWETPYPAGLKRDYEYNPDLVRQY